MAAVKNTFPKAPESEPVSPDNATANKSPAVTLTLMPVLDTGVKPPEVIEPPDLVTKALLVQVTLVS